jgi:O-antigen/teichoic acid export membrane protein
MTARRIGLQRLYQGLAGQTAVYGLSSILPRFLNYLLVPLHTRVFQTGTYGIFNLVYAYVSFFNIVFTYGMETAFFRFFNRPGEDPKRVYNTAATSVLISSPLLAALFALNAGPISRFMGIPGHPEYVIWFAAIMAADAICAVPFARLRQEKKALRFAGLRLFNIGVTIGLNLFFLMLCPLVLLHWPGSPAASLVRAIYRPEIGVGYAFIANLAASLLTMLFFFRDLFGHTFAIDPGLWRRMLRYSLPMLVAGFAGMVNETMDRILLQKWLPLSTAGKLHQIGIYGAVYKLAILMTLFIQAFRMAAEPYFFEKAGNKDAPRTYARVMTWFVFICSTIFLLVMLYLDLFKYFIGPAYHSGLTIVPVLLLANLCLGIYYNLSVWYKLTDKTICGAVLAIGGALITLLLNWWWIPRYGYSGAAWATFCCYAAMMIGGYLWGRRHYPVPYDLPAILALPALALLIYWCSRLLAAARLPIPGLILNSGLLLVYVGTIFLLSTMRNLTRQRSG